MKLWNVVTVIVASLGLLLGGMNIAEAKRLGGGGSFGSKFSQNQSVKRTSADPAKPSAAQTQNLERKQQLAGKGGMMGMLGGLALGGLLGALFFGGAFENINLFDIVMFALLAFVIFKLMSAFMRRNQPTPASAYGNPQPEHYRENSAAGWGTQQDEAPAATPHTDTTAGMTLNDLRGSVPKGFDQRGFLDGAKNCFTRLQQAWDEGDLADIRQFTTDQVFAEIQDQYRARGGATRTEVVTLDATLLSATDLGSRTEAVVFFTGALIEDGADTALREIWHFIRHNNSSQPNWTLDGIQQVED